MQLCLIIIIIIMTTIFFLSVLSFKHIVTTDNLKTSQGDLSLLSMFYTGIFPFLVQVIFTAFVSLFSSNRKKS